VVQNKASVAYFLMFDNQMRMKSGAYLREELSEASDAMMQHPSGAAAQALNRGPACAARNYDGRSCRLLPVGTKLARPPYLDKLSNIVA